MEVETQIRHVLDYNPGQQLLLFLLLIFNGLSLLSWCLESILLSEDTQCESELQRLDIMLVCFGLKSLLPHP